jgi:hypothetical protein
VRGEGGVYLEGLRPSYICSELLRKVYIDFVKYRKWLSDCGLRTQALPKTNIFYFFHNHNASYTPPEEPKSSFNEAAAATPFYGLDFM